MTKLFLLTMVLLTPGCSVLDLAKMCNQYPESCVNLTDAEYIKVNGETVIIDRPRS